MNTQTILDRFVGTEQGWRLLEEDEVGESALAIVWDGIEVFVGFRWVDVLGTAANKSSIYRTKLTRAELAKARGLEPVKAKHKCADCGSEINLGEAETFGVCDKCFAMAHEKAPEPCATPEQLAKLPGGADKWERVRDGVSQKGDYGLWVAGNGGDYDTGHAQKIRKGEDIRAYWENPNAYCQLPGAIVHVYRRKPEPRVAKMPDVPVWWVREPGFWDALVVKVQDNKFCDATGRSFCMENAVAKCGYLWSPDRMTWFNFYGEVVK